MSSRKGAYVTRSERVHGGVSPNAYVPKITVEIRAFWPPSLGHQERVIELIREAAEEAIAEVQAAPYA